jgi:hypothetical protein
MSPAFHHADGTWTVETPFPCPTCCTREYLYTPDGHRYRVTCHGCKSFLGMTGFPPPEQATSQTKGYFDLIHPPKAEVED